MKNKRNQSIFPKGKGWILLAALAVLVVVLLVLLVQMRAAGQSPYKNRATALPQATFPVVQGTRALRYDLAAAADAEAYFQRLLDSDYIGLRGDVSMPAALTDGLWNLREENGDGTALTAVFDPEGVITALSVGTYLGGTMHNSPTPYRIGGDDESLYAYILSFTAEYLPDIVVTSGRVVLDQYNEAGRFVTCRCGGRDTDPAYEFVVQVDPAARIVGFRLLADPADAVVRISRMAETEGTQPDTKPDAPPETQPAETPQGSAAAPTREEILQLARQALVSTLDIPMEEAETYLLIAANRYAGGVEWYGYIAEVPHWLVSFRMPGTPDSIYSDYDVLIDAATGEVLHLFDPSNNSNG